MITIEKYLNRKFHCCISCVGQTKLIIICIFCMQQLLRLLLMFLYNVKPKNPLMQTEHQKHFTAAAVSMKGKTTTELVRYERCLITAPALLKASHVVCYDPEHSPSFSSPGAIQLLSRIGSAWQQYDSFHQSICPSFPRFALSYETLHFSLGHLQQPRVFRSLRVPIPP